MSLRIGTGPVFAYEWLRLSRRWQMYAGRAAFIGLVLLGLCFTWGSWSNDAGGVDRWQLSYFGQMIYGTVVMIELTLILLAAPAATAGAVCVDKARGSLIQVMATDLTDSEIVLGKLAAALLPILGLVFSVLPVLMLASLLGGIDPTQLFGSFLVATATAILVCCLAFTLSVWGRKPHEVLSATYLLILSWLALIPMAGLIVMGMLSLQGSMYEPFFTAVSATNPYVLMYPRYNQAPEEHLAATAVYALACLVISAVMVAVCVLWIRSVAVRHGSDVRRPERRSRFNPTLPRLLPTPSLDANPVLWREWSRSRPSRWSRFISGVFAAFAILLTALAIWDAFAREWGPGGMAVPANIYIVGVGLLLMSVRASTSLAEERIRGSLDILLSTPLTTTEIMAGKWWGTFRRVGPILFLPALIGAAYCLGSGRWLLLAASLVLFTGYAALVTSVGLAIAVWTPRQGRAVGICVGLYALACVGWPMLTAMARHGDSGMIFMFGSPLVGAGFAGVSVMPGPIPTEDGKMMEAFAYCVIWGVAQIGAALLLFRVACESFNGQLGRATDVAENEVSFRFARALIPRFRLRDEPEDPPAEPA